MEMLSGNDPTITINLTFNVSAQGHPFYLKTQATTGTGNQVNGATKKWNGNLDSYFSRYLLLYLLTSWWYGWYNNSQLEKIPLALKKYPSYNNKNYN